MEVRLYTSFPISRSSCPIRGAWFSVSAITSAARLRQQRQLNNEVAFTKPLIWHSNYNGSKTVAAAQVVTIQTVRDWASRTYAACHRKLLTYIAMMNPALQAGSPAVPHSCSGPQPSPRTWHPMANHGLGSKVIANQNSQSAAVCARACAAATWSVC